MNLTITEEQFENLLPFMGTASEDVFEQFKKDFPLVTDMLVKEYVSDENVLNDNVAQEFTIMYVVYEAVLSKLRCRDLILTDTGFGIVSSSEIAPASKERVDAMEKELEWRRDQALERLVVICRSDAWADTICAERAIPSLLWRPSDLKRYAFSATVNKFTHRTERATFGHLQACAQKIHEVEQRFEHHYSTELMDALLREERACSERTINREKVVQLLRKMMGQNIEGLDATADLTFHQIGKTIERHISDFPEYEGSEEFTVNHSPGYENVKQSRAYFF